MSDTTYTATHALLRQRRTIHDFLPEPPPWRQVRKALEAARFAPNHYFTQPWTFYRIGEQTKAAIVDLNARLVEAKKGAAAAQKKRERWTAIPGWLVITSRISDKPLTRREDYAACCCAVQNLMLDLWAAGIGSKWTTGDVIRAAEFYRLLGAKRHQEDVVALLWYGYPRIVPRAQRSPLSSRLVQLP